MLQERALSEQEKEGGFILLNSPERTLRFSNINEVAVPSINRDFSAPIVLKTNLSLEQNLFLLKNDDNGFNRYEITQSLLKKEILGRYSDEEFTLGASFFESLVSVFNSQKMDNATKALLFSLPSLGQLFQSINDIDVSRLNNARKSVKRDLVSYLRGDLNLWLEKNGLLITTMLLTRKV